MNPHLARLHAYPFEKLAQLKHGIHSPAKKTPIVLSIGEPSHPAPHFIQEAMIAHLHGLAHYPITKGSVELRETIAAWLIRRYGLPTEAIDAEHHVLPVNGTREALFSIAHCVVDASAQPVVMMPNPFYQIYEGAALLAGAEPYYLATRPENGFLPDFEAVPEAVWRRCQLLYVCSPGNPHGAVFDMDKYRQVLELAERYDFVIAADECYAELYTDEQHPPLGLLQVAHALGNSAFERCLVFHSLSKRSNVPGLRSGFVAGDAKLIARYLQYRTYHGCAMSLPVQHASIAAWRDEAHVVANRALYREKFHAVIEALQPVRALAYPAGGFYLWMPVAPWRDTDFARALYAQEHVTVLPGSFLSRPGPDGVDPGAGFVRIALVPPLDECLDAARRIERFFSTVTP